MDCDRAQEIIIARFDDAAVPPVNGDLDTHVAGCPRCSLFADTQASLHARLAMTCAPPEMSVSFRARLRRRIAAESVMPRLDAVPDIVHFAACGIATATCALVLPLDATVTLLGGITAALLTYVLLTLVRTSLEDL
jgi:hypothetical protein